MTTRTTAKAGHITRRMIIAMVAMGIIALALGYFVHPVYATKPDPLHKVTICHRTHSETNPYVVNTVDEASVDGNSGNDHGQGDHLFEHTGPVWVPGAKAAGVFWGDIIPPFYSDGVTLTGYPSLNWNAAGQAIFENGCKGADEQLVAESESGDESFKAGEGSVNDSALSLNAVGPLPTIAFSLILLASLGALAFANVKSVRS